MGMIFFMALWYLLVSGRAIFDFLDHRTVSLIGYDEIYRASGEYAPINIFGSSAIGCAVLLLGVSSIPRGAKRWSFFLRVVSLVLLVGAWTSLSRGVMVSLAVGFFVITLYSGKRAFSAGLAVVIAGLLIFYFLPPTLFQGSLERVFQLSDSSTVKRWFYLESGIHSFLAYWPIGAGWGNAFWYYQELGLVPTGFVPWYHNDFLNLAVQTGFLGLFLYIGFWFSLLRAFWVSIRQTANSATSLPFVVGSFAATAALLAGALFEHLLWRPDMGGLVVWVAGIGVVGMKLVSHEIGEA
jgi:O-antigen ligase